MIHRTSCHGGTCCSVSGQAEHTNHAAGALKSRLRLRHLSGVIAVKSVENEQKFYTSIFGY